MLNPKKTQTLSLKINDKVMQQINTCQHLIILGVDWHSEFTHTIEVAEKRAIQ